MGHFKERTLVIDVSAIREPVHRPGTTYFSWDRRTGKKYIEFLNEGKILNLNELSEVEVIFVFYFVEHGARAILCTEDGTVEFDDKLAGRVSVILPNDLYQNWGEVKLCTYIKWKENGEVKSFDAGEIKTKFEESCLDRNLPDLEQFYWRRLENFLADFRAEMAEITNQTNIFKADNMRKFLDWFQLVRDTLGEDAAGNLFNMIWDHERKTFFTHEVHGGRIENGQLQFFIPGVDWVPFSQAFRATWEQRDAMGLTWEQRDAMGLTWIELDNMKGVAR